MAVEILSTTRLKPSLSSPFKAHIPLTIFDKAALDIHFPIILAFQPPTPSNAAMKDRLARVLTYFPHLAGRLSVSEQGSPGIILNNAGIRFIEAYINATLAERLPLEPSTELTTFLPPFDGVEELLQIQLNRFSCGGLVIGATIHHQVADGQSLSTFLLAWSKLVRGLDVGPLPCHDRAAILVPRNPPRCDFNHRAVEFGEISTSKSPKSLVNLAVRFSADFITKLKTHVTVGNLGHRYSTFECILVHLWKKITLARGLQEDEVTHVRVAVNGRPRMKPAVPAEYFGNLVLWAYPKLRVGDLLNGRHAFVAKSIHDAVAQLDDAYFKSFIDFGELSKAREGETKTMSTKPEVGSSLSPDFEVDSWLRFQFHELDFGTGGPCDVIPPYLPLDGLLILVPSCKEKGGIDAFMSLSAEHADHFKQICQSLD